MLTRTRTFLAATAFLAWPLALSADRLHEIGKGDTFYSLGRKYSLTIEELKQANPQINPNALRPGQKIIIPDKDKPAPSVPVPVPGSIAVKPELPSPPKPSAPEPAASIPPPNLPPAERPELYLVKKGDTLFKISHDFGIKIEDLKVWNKLETNALRPGQALRLKPLGSVPAPVPAIPDPSPEKPPEEGVSDPKPPENPSPRLGDTEAKPAIPELSPDPGPKPNPMPVPVPVPAPTEEPKVEPKPEPKPEPAPLPKPPVKPEPVLKESPYLFLKEVKAEIDRPNVKRNRWKYIVIHHSGTPNGNAKIFDVGHRRRGMENGLAYHFVIGNGVKGQSVDGGIEVGGRWRKQLQGGHVRSDALNEISIGICLVGDFERNRPTKKQIAALIELTTYLRDHSNTSRKPVVKMHRDINPQPTDCPGRYFPAKAMYKLFP